MTSAVLTFLGGIGLFLLGMVMLTDGLRALAGGMLRRMLRRSTRSPVSGAATGLMMTAFLQSSSATTVAAIGFVGAGLITFPQSLGIIFGANIGTTVTGWLVAILGFKLELGTVVMPVLFVGVLMHMFGHSRLKSAGWVLAGFSLLFFGITALQQGMSGLNDLLSPEIFPGDNFTGRLQLVLIGVAITLVTQSSSAGVATALAALGVGAVSFPQAAAMVIGMDIGTTFTAALATIGGSVAIRRTGFAHVIFNMLIGTMAFGLLFPLAWFVETYGIGAIGGAQIGLVAFHTTFNVIGVIAVIGFTNQFARLIVKLIPDQGPQLTAKFDYRLLSDPHGAVDAASAGLNDIAQALYEVLDMELTPHKRLYVSAKLKLIEQALADARDYTEKMAHDPTQTHAQQRQIAVLHVQDHLTRLYNRCRRQDRVPHMETHEPLTRMCQMVRAQVQELMQHGSAIEREPTLNSLRTQLEQERHAYREDLIAKASAGEIGTEKAMRRLDGIRWLHRISHHLWRITAYQAIAESEIQLELDCPYQKLYPAGRERIGP